MAIYHTRVKVFSRSKKQSAVAAAAYRAGLSLLDAITGIRHDYSHRNGVVANLCLAPKGAPDWAVDPTRVWNAAQDREKHPRAALAREFELSLPHELTDARRLQLVEEIAQVLVERYGFAIQASIHAPDPPDGLNHHVHFLATTRRMTEGGFGEKTRELDSRDGPLQIKWIRAMAADKINAHLEAAGHAVRVDHRKLAVQAMEAMKRGDLVAAARLMRVPTQHEGKSATAARKAGEVSQRRLVNDAIRHANAENFNERMTRLRNEGRLMATPAAHSHEAALRERSLPPPNAIERAVLATATKAVRLGIPAASHKVRYRTGDKVADALAIEQREREEEIERLMLECARIYLDNLNQPIRSAMPGMSYIFLDHTPLSRLHGSRYRFYADVKELHRSMVRAERDSSRFRRRMATQDRAEHDLGAAQRDLDQFKQQHPHPGLWTKREWAERRRAKAERILLLRQECAKAKTATDAAAQTRYKRQAEESLATLHHAGKQFAARYLTQLASSMPLPEELGEAAGEEPVRTKRGRRSSSKRVQMRVDPVPVPGPNRGPIARL